MCKREQENSMATAGNEPLIDPVCGMTVTANPERLVVHEDHDYYFCSKNCMAKFSTDPQSWVHSQRSDA